MRNLIIVISLLAATPTLAQQTQNFYSSSGRYMGQAVTTGNQTDFYSNSGRYQGQAIRSGNQIDFYSNSGRYEGQMMSDD